jgi:hypothetical protein
MATAAISVFIAARVVHAMRRRHAGRPVARYGNQGLGAGFDDRLTAILIFGVACDFWSTPIPVRSAHCFDSSQVLLLHTVQPRLQVLRQESLISTNLTVSPSHNITWKRSPED